MKAGVGRANDYVQPRSDTARQRTQEGGATFREAVPLRSGSQGSIKFLRGALTLAKHAYKPFWHKPIISREKHGLIDDGPRFYRKRAFKNPLEQIARGSIDLKSRIERGLKEHMSSWNRQWPFYEKIMWNTWGIKNKLDLT